MKKPYSIVVALALATIEAGCQKSTGPKIEAPSGQWVALFNGKDLNGWLPKVSHHPLGENYANTFRVENGLLNVAYDQYQDFGTQTGALFYHQPFARYWLRVEYRFIGTQPPGAPEWAYKDNGIQFHSPAPSTMTLDQEFPVSVEFNLVGGKRWWRKRPTGNVCTPSTVVEMEGTSIAECSTTSHITVHGDDWVTALLHVDGSKNAKHYVNGELVASYQNLKLDANDPLAKKLIDAGAPIELSEGYISIQSNSHPIQFRKIELLPIGGDQ